MEKAKDWLYDLAPGNGYILGKYETSVLREVFPNFKSHSLEETD